MSIALHSCGGGGRRRVERPGLIPGMPYISIYDTPEPIFGMLAENQRFPSTNGVVGVGGRKGKGRERDVESSSSSSIGRDSDSSDKSSDGGDAGDDQVQSSFKGPLDTMDALEDVLPVKRGISKFYNGKSKSFTSLAEASSVSSIEELAKPENAYTRKRKNLLVSSRAWEKNPCFSSRPDGGGSPKRQANDSRSTVIFSMTLSSMEGCNSSGSPNSTASSPSRCRPPLHPQTKSCLNNGSLSSSPEQKFSPWRSFSLSDLHCVAASHHSVGDHPVTSSGDNGNSPH
ncbi:hypothetical protein Dimus_025867 [Dionaea muscipula]